LQNVKVESIQPEVEGNGWPLVHLSDGTTIRARLLTDSTRLSARTQESPPMDGRTTRKL